MGFFKNRYVIWVIIVISLSPSYFVEPSNLYGYNYDSKSLSNFFHDYVNKSIVKTQTGILYNIPLPSNFSGMDVTFVRLRSGSLRNRGANFSSFYIPPKVVPNPYVKRLAIVYENLGNWSSLYYKVPNYSLVASVVGFTVYDSPSVLGTEKLNLSVKGKPISIWFDDYVALRGKNDTPKCVKFSDDGGFEINNMTSNNGCIASGQGHFSIVVPSSPHDPMILKKKKTYWKWWLIGFGGGFVGVVLLILASTAIFKIVKRKRLRAMEKQSEQGVAFDTLWVGASKMPSVSMVRTQPTIENDYVP